MSLTEGPSPNLNQRRYCPVSPNYKVIPPKLVFITRSRGCEVPDHRYRANIVTCRTGCRDPTTLSNHERRLQRCSNRLNLVFHDRMSTFNNEFFYVSIQTNIRPTGLPDRFPEEQFFLFIWFSECRHFVVCNVGLGLRTRTGAAGAPGWRVAAIKFNHKGLLRNNIKLSERKGLFSQLQNLQGYHTQSQR